MEASEKSLEDLMKELASVRAKQQASNTDINCTGFLDASNMLDPPEIRLSFGKMKRTHYFMGQLMASVLREKSRTQLCLNVYFDVDCVHNEDCFLPQCDEEYRDLNIVFSLIFLVMVCSCSLKYFHLLIGVNPGGRNPQILGWGLQGGHGGS